MEMIEKIAQKANKTYLYTTEMTKKLTNEAKLKMKMSQKKEEIQVLFEDIGKLIYQNRILEELEKKQEISDEIQHKCYEIDKRSDDIEEIRKELLSLKNKKQCIQCYTEICSCYQYCPHCGKEQD